MPFLNKTLDVRMVEGAGSNVRVLRLMDDLDYFSLRSGRTFRVIRGTETDGLSVPQCLTNIIPAHGEWAWDGYLHDAAYHESLIELRADGLGWMVPGLDKDGKDLLLHEALLDQGCPGWMAEAIYLAVKFGAGSAFAGDMLLTIPTISQQTEKVLDAVFKPL